MKMKKSLLFSLLVFFALLHSSSSTLVDGLVTLSWASADRPQLLDRFLENNTRIQLKVLCRDPSYNTNVTREQIKKKLDKLDQTVKETTIEISGRIGRVVGCLPLENDVPKISYEQLWEQMEYRTFQAHQSSCDLSGTQLFIDRYSALMGEKNSRSSPLLNSLRSSTSTGSLSTWAEGYYLIEINAPEISTEGLNADVIVSIKNRHGGYLTADEYPALIFYAVMCGVYAFFALIWFVWCAFYWRDLMKIQFWIAGVILLGMIEKSAFVAEYDTLNRNGSTVVYAIITAEILSCLKRAVSRMLVIIVALGYGLVKPRLGPLKGKVIGMGVLYFALASVEAILRLKTKHDEVNNRVLVARIPLAVVDGLIYYWIFTGLVATIRTLRLRKNLAKLSVYRHFTNTILFAIVVSLFFVVWSLKSHFFTRCLTNWREFWIDDAFWHLLFSLILLVIIVLFRPSNNNQRYAFVPLLDQSDNEEQDVSIFETMSMRKGSQSDLPKSKKSVEDALAWVEDNLPTSLADHALETFDDGGEIVDTILERSKMQ